MQYENLFNQALLDKTFADEINTTVKDKIDDLKQAEKFLDGGVNHQQRKY